MCSKIISLKELSKQFPGVLAVDKADLDIEDGKIHAIVGGNGAGKSTLIKMISGVYPYGTYEGDFYLNGEICQFKSLLDAEAKGIALVPQDLNMVNEMTVADNLFISNQPTKFALIDQYKMMSDAQKVLDDFELKLSPATLVKEIGIAQKQLIVIARAMFNKVKVLILDEPTATLSNDESELLFRKVRELRERGVACIYISHRLEEVASISDMITVMRDGRIIETRPTKEITEKEIVSLMVGRDVKDYYPEKTHTPGDILFEAHNLNVYSKKIPGLKIVDNVSFDIKKSEILAVYGLVGSGRTEMAQGIIGSWKGNVEYELRMNGKVIENHSPAAALKNGLSLLPEDRKREGIIGCQSVAHNISASSLDRFSLYGVIDSQKEIKNSIDKINAISIKTNSMRALVNTLSGGNQQKVVLSRLISAETPLLILDEATQGIDVEAKSQIYSILDKLASEGKSILFISSDIAEVMGIADRIMIVRQGKIVKILENKNLDKEKVLWYATVGLNEV